MFADRNTLATFFSNTYLKNEVLCGIDDEYDYAPDASFKSCLLQHFQKKNILHKDDFHKTSLFALGVDSSWKMMMWVEILEHVIEDPIVKQLSLSKNFFFLTHPEKKEHCVRCLSNTETNPLPIEMAWCHENISNLIHGPKNSVIDLIMNRFHTHVIGLSVKFCNFLFGWDMNKSEFALFNFSFTNHRDLKDARDVHQLDEKVSKVLEILFPEIYDCSLIFSNILETVMLNKRDHILLLMKKMSHHLNSLIFLPVFYTFGFRNYKHELEACRNRNKFIQKLMQEI